MSICKHRVLDKCKISGYMCTQSDRCFEEEKKLTNVDYIRSMSDEELAEFLYRGEFEDEAEKPGVPCVTSRDILDWLQAERQG